MPSLHEQLQRWQKDLINLGKTNRLLHYRPTRTSTLEIGSPGIAQLIQRLEAHDQTLEFYGSDSAFDPDNPTLAAFYSIQARGVELRSVRPILRQLERRVTQEYLDRGVWILYLAIGMLEWYADVQQDAELVRSPLLLLPVQLKRGHSRAPYVLEMAEEDPAINPALATKLEQDFRVSLPTVEDYEEGGLAQVFSAVHSILAEQPGWSLAEVAVLSTFSFHKEVIYRDLKNNEEPISQHHAIQALVPGAVAQGSFDFERTPEEMLDIESPPEDAVNILDADASQRECIAAVCAGRSFVMDGPPGTGKSQTIANMIVELLARGRSVMFVSEKAAALDIVTKRLERAGVSDYCLELHSHKASRKEVAVELGRTLQTHVEPPAALAPADRERLKAVRRALTDYAVAMNEVRRPLELSVFDIVGRLTKLKDLPVVPDAEGLNSRTLDPATLAAIRDEATRLAAAWGPVERGDGFLWRDLCPSVGSSIRARAAQAACEAAACLEAAWFQARQLSSQLGFSEPDGPTASSWLLRIHAHLVTRRHEIPVHWLSAPQITQIESSIADFERFPPLLVRARERLQEIGGPQWQTISTEGRLKGTPQTIDLQRRRVTIPAHWRESELENLGDFCKAAGPRLEAVLLKATQIAGQLGLTDRKFSLARAKQLAELARVAADPVRPEREWLNPVVLEECQSGLGVLSQLVADGKRRRANVTLVFKDETLARADLEDLAVRFGAVHHGLRKLLPRYWKDRAIVAECARDGRAGKAAIACLGEAVQCQRALRRIDEAEDGAPFLVRTHLYRGLSTNFSRLEQALKNAAVVLEVVGSQLSPPLLDSFSQGGAVQPSLALAGKELAASLAALSEEASAARLPEVIPGLDQCDLESLAKRLAAIAEPLLWLALRVRVTGGAIGKDLTFAEADKALDLSARLAALEREFAQLEPSHRQDLGSLYDGPDTDAGVLRECMTWAKATRHIVGGACPAEVAARLVGVAPDAELLRAELASWDSARERLLAWFVPARAEALVADLSGSWRQALELIRRLEVSAADIDEWYAFESSCERLSSLGLRELVRFAITNESARSDLANLVTKSALTAWLEDVIRGDVRLQDWQPMRRDQLVTEFADLDRRLVSSAASVMISACNGRKPRTSIGLAGVILREAEKVRRHMPVRRLLEQTAQIITTIKPCFLMSPLSVSQFLPPSLIFDVVIFDEASQVRPADAINAIYRSRQLVVAGDQKQLPPTTFFEVASDGDDEWDEDTEDDPTPFDSVLDLCKGSGSFPSLSLRWHYRSQHEDLITFSNREFYGGRLITFPSAQHNSPDLGVELIAVDGRYQRGGRRDNPIEADKVVERIVHHRRHHPHCSIGVVAFSEAQAQAIEDRLDASRDRHPELQKLATEDRLDGLFVKNLETVQGDERDIIIFSIGYARDENGRFTLNLGPLNRSGGQRRLNVAITRARRRIEVVTSITASDLRSATKEGVVALGRYLQYASLPSPDRLPFLVGTVDCPDPDKAPESEFEEEVARVIRSWGFKVVHQVGTAGYRVDLGVLDPQQEDRYLLAVECDGAMYHSSKVARDRDRLRQEVLERLGWRVHRVWGPSWYRDRGGAEARLWEALTSQPDSRPVNPGPQPPTPMSTQPSRRVLELRDEVSIGVQYEVCRPVSNTSGREMHDVDAQDELRRLISAVVETEGPVHEEVVLRRVREAWGVYRAGNRIRDAFKAALGRTTVKRDDGFLFFPHQRPAMLRVPDTGVPATLRGVSEVHPEELREAIRLIVAAARALDREELTRRVASVFGWARRGPDIAAALDREINVLKCEGLLFEDGTAITLNADCAEEE